MVIPFTWSHFFFLSNLCNRHNIFTSLHLCLHFFLIIQHKYFFPFVGQYCFCTNHTSHFATCGSDTFKQNFQEVHVKAIGNTNFKVSESDQQKYLLSERID